MHILKTHFLHRSLIVKSQQDRTKLVTRPAYPRQEVRYDLPHLRFSSPGLGSGSTAGGVICRRINTSRFRQVFHSERTIWKSLKRCRYDKNQKNPLKVCSVLSAVRGLFSGDFSVIPSNELPKYRNFGIVRRKLCLVRLNVDLI